MSVEEFSTCNSSGLIENYDHEISEESPVSWNRREVTSKKEILEYKLLEYLKAPSPVHLVYYRGDVSNNSEKKGPLWGYFDSEAKKQNKFDIAVYQYHIRCNNEESKKHLEKSFEMMATGMVGVVIGIATFIHNPAKGSWMVFVVAERVWKGVEEFKEAMETSGTQLEDVTFVTWYDDYERNTEELTKNSILEPWKPLDTSGFDIMDEQYKRKQLDPSLSNNIRDYA